MTSENISIDDFNESDFLDPISLIEALQRLSLQSQKQVSDEGENDMLTIEQIQESYGLSIEYIRSSLLAGTISPSNLVMYFSRNDIERIAAEASSVSPLTAVFEKELDKMVMNYSYKPLLLLALFSKDNMSAKVDDIIDYYFAFYSGRAKNGQAVEKGDSSFIQNPDDRLAARRTILRYPVSVLAKKAFVAYDKELDMVSVNPLLVSDKQHINAGYVCSRCLELLDKYYKGCLD